MASFCKGRWSIFFIGFCAAFCFAVICLRKMIGILKCFGFLGKDLLETDQFMLKTSFRDRALSAFKEQINVEMKKSGRGTRSAEAAVVIANYNPFSMHVGWSWGRYVRNCCGTQPVSLILLLVWPVVIFLCCLNFLRARVLSVSSLFKNFSDRQWTAKENRGLFKDWYMEIIDDQRNV